MKIGLPVFSSGYSCQDVRKRATLDSFNKKIKINEVEIIPGDLVYGDTEGIVVIPKKIEAVVINEVFKKISNEKKILIDISAGANVEKLITDYGFF